MADIDVEPEAAYDAKNQFDLDAFKRKHHANDLSVFFDFENMVIASNSKAFVKACWEAFPDAQWTRASGHLFQHMVDKNQFELARMFYEHKMFRMSGGDIAESLKDQFLF